MRRIPLRAAPLVAGLLLALGAAAACGDSTKSKGLSPTQVNGNWRFTLTRVTSCPFSVQGDLFATIDFKGSGDVGNTVSTWSNDPQVPNRFTLIGNVRFGTGATELRFWSTVQKTGTLVTGTFKADGSFTGTAEDPIPGYQPYLSLDGCAYNVSGRRA